MFDEGAPKPKGPREFIISPAFRAGGSDTNSDVNHGQDAAFMCSA